MLRFSQCALCVHYHWERSAGLRTCDAFPGGIPSEIYQNRVPHEQTYPGDNGITFEEDPNWAGDGDDDFTPTGPAFE